VTVRIAGSDRGGQAGRTNQTRQDEEVAAMADAGQIVVGVDGSPGSRAALRWAVGQARLTGATVRAITVWGYPTGHEWTALPTNYGTVPLPVVPDRADLRESAQRLLADVIGEVVGPEPDVPIEATAVDGHATAVLLAASERAELLVLGRRGHGGFAGLLLGSVSRQCVEHAACGVVVVPAD
jgi:nucleotide-binding universal stress UspA family protein